MRLALAVLAVVGVGASVPLAVWLAVLALRWFKAHPEHAAWFAAWLAGGGGGPSEEDGAGAPPDGLQDGSGPNAFQAWLGGLVDGLNEAPAHPGEAGSTHGGADVLDPGSSHAGVDGGVDAG